MTGNVQGEWSEWHEWGEWHEWSEWSERNGRSEWSEWNRRICAPPPHADTLNNPLNPKPPKPLKPPVMISGAIPAPRLLSQKLLLLATKLKERIDTS